MKHAFLICLLFIRLPARATNPPLCAGAWTLAHIPDIQNYVSDTQRTAIVNAQMTWLAAHRAARNICFAVEVGDLVNDNGSQQWDRARGAFDIITGQIPFALCSGNHDCGPGGSGNSRATQFSLNNRFGPVSPYGQQPTVGAFFQHPDDPPGNTQNAWHTFRCDRQDYLVLTCEWGPRDKVVAWMDDIVAARPFHRAILVCHAYLASGTARFDWAQTQSGMNPHSFGISTGADGVNDGQELWEKLVRKHENFFLVSCGHAGRGFRTVTGDHGNKVHEMLYNTQELANGGDGWLRLLEFYPDGRTVQARTFSTHRDEWDESATGSFRFSLSPVSSADSDADGLPDYWEHQHQWALNSPGNADSDPDHDGATNRQEYTAGTAPLNAASVLALHSVSSSPPGGMTLRWQSVPGMKYRVQECSDLNTTPWMNTGTIVTATDVMTSTTVACEESRKFLRVAISE